MEFSKKLRKLRNEKGISQQILANAVFVSRSAVAKWENGLGLPSEESLEALANFFDVPKEFLKTDTPEIIVIEKNKKIKKLSGSMCGIILAVASALIIYALFHPISYYASARWSKIEVQTTLEAVSAFEITDKNVVDNLEAVFYVKSEDSDGADIWLCSSGSNKFSVYIWNGKEELVVYNAENLGYYLFQLIENRK